MTVEIVINRKGEACSFKLNPCFFENNENSELCLRIKRDKHQQKF
jgi:hypothetical protein